MAATTHQGGVFGTEIFSGQSASVITAAETNQLKDRSGKVGQVVVWGDDAGTSCTLDLYNNASANSGKVWRWVTADGTGVFALQLPMSAGIRVVTAGTLPTNGGITVIWS